MAKEVVEVAVGTTKGGKEEIAMDGQPPSFSKNCPWVSSPAKVPTVEICRLSASASKHHHHLHITQLHSSKTPASLCGSVGIGHYSVNRTR